MAFRLHHVSIGLVLASVALSVSAQGGQGMGRTGTYPPQYAPDTPSRADQLDVWKAKHAAQRQAGDVDVSDVGGTPEVAVSSGHSAAEKDRLLSRH